MIFPWGPKYNFEPIIKIDELYERRTLNICVQTNKTQKNGIVNEKSTIALGKPNISIKELGSEATEIISNINAFTNSILRALGYKVLSVLIQ